VEIGQVYVDPAACRDKKQAACKQERLYVAWLKNVTGYVVREQDLKLYGDKSTSPILVFERQVAVEEE
jgi:hypothetical protein